MGFWDNTLGAVTGGLAGNEDYGFVDNIAGGVGDYFMADTRAARAQQKAARTAEGMVGEGYDTALEGYQGLADKGTQDYDRYRSMVDSGSFGTDPSAFTTGQYQAQSPVSGPGFNAFNAGQAPGFDAFQRQQGPNFQEFQREQGPQFNRADAGNFEFDYQSSPGYEFARDQGIEAIEGRASAQGRRFTGGTDKEIAELASNMAAQDYGNQFNRARGSFEADRGFGAQQTGMENQFNQGNYQFVQGLDAQQAALANQFNQGNYQFETELDAQQSAMANQFNQGNFQFVANLGAQQSNLANSQNMQNFWNAQNQAQQDRQFGFNANQGANLQNYNMLNQQQQQRAGLLGGLAEQGYGSQVNLANMQIGRGEAMANAALGVGNANANRAMATRNTTNNTLNTLANVGGTIAAFTGKKKGK